MTITGTAKTKAVRNSYPSEEGIIAETTKTSDNQINLIAEEGSLVPKRDKIGMMD